MADIDFLDSTKEDINNTDKQLYNLLLLDERLRDKENIKIVKLLLEYKVDPNFKTIKDDTPLHKACKNIEIVKLLSYNIPLHIACKEYNIEAVKSLLEYKADPNIQDNDGNTALHIVCEYNYIELIEILLKYKADPNIQNNDGYTPLHIASKRGNIKLVELLLERKADINAKDKDYKNTSTYCIF